MSDKVRTITNNRKLDNIFINFPLWFPLLYIFITTNFPSSSKILFISSLFLFAETHFASTWLFFFDNKNWGWIKKNYYKIIFIPSYLLFLVIVIWFFSPSLIIILHYLASGWHVTKQSIGILKINQITKKYYSFTINIISFLCLFFGLLNPGIISATLTVIQLNTIILFCSIVYIWVLFQDTAKGPIKYLPNLMPLITGILIYLPLLFFKNLAVATAVGVGMHWCQYIAIMWSIELRKNRKKSKKNNFSSIFKKSISSKLIFIFTYSIVMTTCVLLGMPEVNEENVDYSLIYLLPLLFQFFHFYIDGFIWKFSDPHIRENVMSNLFTNVG
tara:strand:- start:173 stop:1162 length:990 start_codon:yes stop_codon:yes gene_type:complete